MSLLNRRHWIFDMDGTLTLAAHDFAAFKSANGMPTDRPILEVLAEYPEQKAQRIHARLSDWEEDIARRAVAAADARTLLTHLHTTGHVLGVLTRNSRRVATITLEAAQLSHFFAPQVVLGRDDAEPKPDPAGILRLLEHWGAAAEDAVMVGDYLFDLEAGRAAGVATVLIDRLGDRHWDCDLRVTALDSIIKQHS